VKSKIDLSKKVKNKECNAKKNSVFFLWAKQILHLGKYLISNWKFNEGKLNIKKNQLKGISGIVIDEGQN
jgi:hypothetical protein